MEKLNTSSQKAHLPEDLSPTSSEWIKSISTCWHQDGESRQQMGVERAAAFTASMPHAAARSSEPSVLIKAESGASQIAQTCKECTSKVGIIKKSSHAEKPKSDLQSDMVLVSSSPRKVFDCPILDRRSGVTRYRREHANSGNHQAFHSFILSRLVVSPPERKMSNGLRRAAGIGAAGMPATTYV